MSATPWGTTLFFEVSSAAPDEDPVWVDLSDRVLDVGMPAETWEGRQTELEDVEPGRFQLQLRNRDDALTPGNPSSPYPWFKQKRRARIREIVGYVGFDLADGFLEIPEVVVRTQEELAVDSDVTLFVSGVDVMGRLRDSRKMISALAEHVLYEGGTDLVGYWPLTDAAQPFLGVGPELDPVTVTRNASGTVSPFVDVQPQAGLAPGGGEGSGIRCTVETNNGGIGYGWVRVSLPDGYAPPIADGEAFVAVAWYSLGTSALLSQDILSIFIDGAGATGTSIDVRRNTTTGVWTFEVTGTQTGSSDFGLVGAGQLLPIGVYYRSSTSTAELWVGAQRLSLALAGAPLTGMSLDIFNWAFQTAYDLSHWQIYVGTAWGRSQFLEQIQQGHAPLDKQRTGDRVNTILNYAGFPAGLRDVDPGVSVMQEATLAGKNVQQLLDEANDTERGRTFAHAGRVKFHDRRRIYDV